MRRRQFITLLGGAAATSAGPVVARAQQADRMRRIGLLLSASQADAEQQARVAALRDGLRTLGWIEGRNFRVEERWAVADSDLLKKYVQELLDLAPDLIVTGSTPGAQLLRLADRPIPVVFAGIADPVGSGVVPSLARPGGNITGFTAFEYAISGKWLALLKELSPQIEQVALIFNAGIGRYVENFWRSFEASALSIGIKPVRMAVRDATEIENAIAAFAKEPNGGLLSVPEVTVSLHRDLIIGLAARYRMPMIYPYRFFPRRGGLASYGIDVNDQWRRSATYVDRILKGEKPADLPVQAPIKFEFVINLKTAKTLGLTVPLTLLAQADEVIE